MKRTFFRAFGIACFLIGMLIFFIDRYDFPISLSNSENTTKNQQDEVDKLKKQLKDANKQIEKLQKQLKDDEKKDEASKTTDDTTDTAKDSEQDTVVKGTLYIYSGLSIFDVAKKLKEMGIIENSVEMELFLAQPEYSRSLQIGQYELDSSMSIEEIANIITGKEK